MKRGLTIFPIGSVDELLRHALVKLLVPIGWTEESEVQPVLPAQSEDRPGVITH